MRPVARTPAAGVSGAGTITGATAFIRRTASQSPASTTGKPTQEADSPIWRQPLELRNFTAEATCDIPRLAEGKYVFGVQLKGGQGVPCEPVEQPFARQVFP